MHVGDLAAPWVMMARGVCPLLLPSTHTFSGPRPRATQLGARHRAYLHADYRHSQIRPSEVDSQGAQGFEDMVNVLRDVLLHGRETEFLL